MAEIINSINSNLYLNNPSKLFHSKPKTSILQKRKKEYLVIDQQAMQIRCIKVCVLQCFS